MTTLETRERAPLPRGGSVDKIEKYNWAIRGDKPEFAWIKKNDLKIDPSYQRDQKQARAVEIAKDWSWPACGAIYVSLRETGEWFVFDGQHRVAAALLRSDIDDLPCLIFEIESIPEEAGAFLDANLKRKTMSWAERFRALLVQGRPEAKFIEELVQRLGRRVSASAGPQTVSCVSILIECCGKDKTALSCVLPIAAELCADKPLHGRLVKGLFLIECKIGSSGASLKDKKWRARLQKIGHDEIMASIQRACVYEGHATAEAAAKGIAKAMNKGLRGDLLPFGDEVSEE